MRILKPGYDEIVKQFGPVETAPFDFEVAVDFSFNLMWTRQVQQVISDNHSGDPIPAKTGVHAAVHMDAKCTHTKNDAGFGLYCRWPWAFHPVVRVKAEADRLSGADPLGPILAKGCDADASAAKTLAPLCRRIREAAVRAVELSIGIAISKFWPGSGPHTPFFIAKQDKAEPTPEFLQAIPKHITVQVRFPIQQRSAHMLDDLLALEVVEVTDGEIVLGRAEEPDELSETVLLRAGARFMRMPSLSKPMSYTFVHRQSTSVRQLAAVADLYGITDPFVNWMRENKLEDVIAPFTLSLRIPEEYVAAWLNAPGERTRYYASGYAAMSLAMQAVLRRLGATLWMDATPEFWTQTRTRAFLVYAASRPYTGRLVHQLTIDHLDKRVMDTYFRHVVRNLPEAKMRFASVLRGLGQRHAAELLRKRDVPRLIATLRDRATELDDLLVLDANAMSSMLKVGVMGSRIHRIWRTRRTRAMPHIPKLPKELKRDLWPRLKRRFGNRHGVALGHILFLEATNVLHGVVAGASGLEASIHVHLPDGTQSFSGSRK